MLTNDSNNNNLNSSPFGFGGFRSDFKPSTIITEGFDIQGTHWGMHNNDMNNLHMAFIIYRDNLDSLRNFYKLPKEPYILENIYLKKLKPRIFLSKEAQKELRGLTLKEQTEYIRTTLVLVKGVNEAFKYIEAEDKKFSIALNWLYREKKITYDSHTEKYSLGQRTEEDLEEIYGYTKEQFMKRMLYYTDKYQHLEV